MGEAGRGQEVEFHKQLLLPHFPDLKMGQAGRGQEVEFHKQLLLPHFQDLKMGEAGRGQEVVLIPAALAHGAWFTRPASVFHLRADSHDHGQRFARDHDITRRKTHSCPHRAP